MWAMKKDAREQARLRCKGVRKVDFHPTAYMMAHDGFPMKQLPAIQPKKATRKPRSKRKKILCV